MSSFKVVPMEPTAEMVEAAEEAYMPFGDMDLAIRMALLTAPDVQQPELAKYQPCGCVICTCEHETQCQGCGARHCGTHPVGQFSEPAYLQPAEQKPLSQAWDGEGVPPIGTVCEYRWVGDDWRRCEIVGHYFGSVVGVDVVDASALRFPVDLLRPIKTPEQIAAEEQQPAPDVSGLVGALEDLVSEIESVTCVHDNTHRGGVIWEICEDCGCRWADDRGGKPEFTWPESVEKARALIAAHRKGGE